MQVVYWRNQGKGTPCLGFGRSPRGIRGVSSQANCTAHIFEPDGRPRLWQCAGTGRAVEKLSQGAGKLGPRDLGTLLLALATYRVAREEFFLAALGCPQKGR